MINTETGEKLFNLNYADNYNQPITNISWNYFYEYKNTKHINPF